jgi:N,N-dimethylformamidase
MIPLAGYADRLSARPGETIRFHVSNATGAVVSARMVRVLSADANPAGPGIKTEPVNRGSYVRVDLGRRLAELQSFSLAATIWPTRLGHGEQPILSWLDPTAAAGVALLIDANGLLTARAGLGRSLIVQVNDGPKLTERVWTHVWCHYDANTKTLEVSTNAADGTIVRSARRVLEQPIAATANTWLAIAAGPDASFNGKIEYPLMFDAVVQREVMMAAAAGQQPPQLLAAWNFGKDMSSSRIIDTGPHALHGVLINQPTRAMTGANWTGREMCWRHAPEQYGAIHFHDDDIDDCRWPVAFEWTIPRDTRSGNYALLIAAGAATDNIPVFVVPAKGTRTADVAVLVSTYTYTVYANFSRPEWTRDPAWREAWVKQSEDWGAYPHNPGAHIEYGLSTYNFHTDGSGIGYSTWHRPMLNMRIGYITYPYADIRASGLRHYPADMHLTAWLDAKGIAYDIITDAELHSDGATLLQPYAAVMTGSHPEYHTPDMLDALQDYRDGGGRLMYLGGNGFYWKIALSPDKNGVIEIRRGEGGIRAWAAETGEYYNAFDGEYGGLWRRNGRPPQKLAGVGFTAQGNFIGSHYRIKPEARQSRAGWMFEGIAEDTIGGFGLSGHGAAGFELDRADKRLGTPAHALILAASEGHKPDAPWVLVPEEQLTHIVTWAGEPAAALIRADIVFFETPNNGAVFATGSITFCGSLPSHGFDNSISRLLLNVLTRFSDRSARFDVPV